MFSGRLVLSGRVDRGGARNLRNWLRNWLRAWRVKATFSLRLRVLRFAAVDFEGLFPFGLVCFESQVLTVPLSGPLIQNLPPCSRECFRAST